MLPRTVEVESGVYSATCPVSSHQNFAVDDRGLHSWPDKTGIALFTALAVYDPVLLTQVNVLRLHFSTL